MNKYVKYFGETWLIFLASSMVVVFLASLQWGTPDPLLYAMVIWFSGLIAFVVTIAKYSKRKKVFN